MGLLKAAVRHVDAFIAPSRFSKDVHDKRLDIPIVHLPNFVPLSEIEPPCTKRSSPKPRYFLFVGRLEILKGPQTLIPLFRRYPKAQLWIAGRGTCESRLRELAGGSSNIRFLGGLSSEQLQTLYREAVAVIVPSLYYENFPLVIIEAFGQQTPVIVRNLGGLPEIVRESSGGFIYSSDEELEAAMERLLADPSAQRDLGRRGYEAYKRSWTAEAHMQGYLGLIRQIASSRNQPKGTDRARL